MDSAIRNEMAENLEAYFRDNNHGLWAPQLAARERINKFLRLNVGDPLPLSEEEIRAYETENSRVRPGRRVSLRKEGDFLEIVSATGTGKTRLFGEVARGINMPVLIVTPRNILNRQTLNEFATELNLDPTDIGIYDGQQSPAERWNALSKRYLITTDKSLPSLIAREHVTPEFRPLVILDELWAMQGPAIRQALEEGGFLDRSQVMAFMATDDGVQFTYGHGQAPIYNLRLRPAIESGYLVDRVRTTVVDVDINRDDPELLRLFQEWEREYRDRDYPEHLIRRFAENPAIINGALNYHMGYREGEEIRPGHSDPDLGAIWRYPTVFYTFGVKAAEEGAKMFNKRARELGLRIDDHYARAEVIHGEMTREQQQRAVDRLKSGKIQALFNDRVIQMGFDDPNLTCVYSLKPSRGSTEPTQMLGRGTRRECRENPKENSYIYRDRFGVDKATIGVNIRTATMRPYTFFQVLENRPEVYNLVHCPSTGGTGRDDHPRWPDWMRVRTTAGEMREVSALPVENRDTLLSVGEGWDSKASIRNCVVVKGEKYNAAFDQFWDWLNSDDNRPRGQETRVIALKEGQIETQMRVDGLGRAVLTIHMEPPEAATDIIRNHLDIPKDISPEVSNKVALRRKITQRLGKGLNAVQSESFDIFWEMLQNQKNHPLGRERKTVDLGGGHSIQTELRAERKSPEVVVVTGEADSKQETEILNLIQKCCAIDVSGAGNSKPRGRKPSDPPNHHEDYLKDILNHGGASGSFEEKIRPRIGSNDRII